MSLSTTASLGVGVGSKSGSGASRCRVGGTQVGVDSGRADGCATDSGASAGAVEDAPQATAIKATTPVNSLNALRSGTCQSPR